MTRLLQELRDEFDWVLIDCPPVATMSDAQILGSLVDMVVFVVRHGAVEKPLALRAIQVLKSTNPNIIGAVLNSVDPSRHSFPEYYYGKDYYTKAGAPSTGGTDLVLTAVDEKG